MEEDIKFEINKQGGRLTKQRSVILEYLHSVDSHPCAEEIYENVKKKVDSLSIATVYRNLKYLAENGYIIQLNTSDGKSRYDGNSVINLFQK